MLPDGQGRIDSADLILPQSGESVGAAVRLHRLDLLRERLEQSLMFTHLSNRRFEWLLAAGQLRHAGGRARLGARRLCALLRRGRIARPAPRGLRLRHEPPRAGADGQGDDRGHRRLPRHLRRLPPERPARSSRPPRNRKRLSSSSAPPVDGGGVGFSSVTHDLEARSAVYSGTRHCLALPSISRLR